MTEEYTLTANQVIGLINEGIRIGKYFHTCDVVSLEQHEHGIIISYDGTGMEMHTGAVKIHRENLISREFPFAPTDASADKLLTASVQDLWKVIDCQTP
jgi:hypothetical protein